MPVRKLYNRLIKDLFHKQVGRFLVVGSAAFLVNALLLYLFRGVMELPILLAQLLGAEGTITFSFFLHHHWTYRHYKKKSLFIRFIEFNGSALGGSLISTLFVLIATELLHVHYLIGLGVGAIIATFWNYFSNQYFIWTKAKRLSKHEVVDNLRAEAKIFATYLVGRRPSGSIINRYEEAIIDSKQAVDYRDRRLLDFSRKYRRIIGLIDAGLALSRPHSEVRRRLFVMLAILESSPEYVKYFLPRKRSPLYAFAIAYAGMRSAFKAMFGIIIVALIR